MSLEPHNVEPKLEAAGMSPNQAQQVENVRLAGEVGKMLPAEIDELQKRLEIDKEKRDGLAAEIENKRSEYKGKVDQMHEARNSLEINCSMIVEAHILLEEDDRLRAETRTELDGLPGRLVEELKKIEVNKEARLTKSKAERMEKRRRLRADTDGDFAELATGSGGYKSELALIAKLGELSEDSRLGPTMSVAMERVGAAGGLGGLVEDLRDRTISMANKRGELAEKLRGERIELDTEAEEDEKSATAEAKKQGDEARAEYARMQNVLVDRLELYDRRKEKHQGLLGEVDAKKIGLEQALQLKTHEADEVARRIDELRAERWSLIRHIDKQGDLLELFVGALKENEANLVSEAGGVLRAAEFVINDLSEDLESQRAVSLREIDDAESEAIRLISKDEDEKIRTATDDLKRKEADAIDGLVETGLYIRGESGEIEMKPVKGLDMVISERKRRGEADAIIDELIVVREAANEAIDDAEMKFVDEVVRAHGLRDVRVKTLDQEVSVQRAQLNSASAALGALNEIVPSIPDGAVDKGSGIFKATMKVLNGLIGAAKKLVS